ncbi:hypothetical protein ACJRO7_015745 [Eucalyptus globulus]|uniref:Legumain prodomain domain-containing protein n=1 Tax=Eucalyptus globulus TaxID=34317 RepID=A0ABD3L5R4_EUCGL
MGGGGGGGGRSKGRLRAKPSLPPPPRRRWKGPATEGGGSAAALAVGRPGAGDPDRPSPLQTKLDSYLHLLILFVLRWDFLLLLIMCSIYALCFHADVCHAYQLLKKGGLKDENIIIFMYDDIANNEENPQPGIVINNPNGDDVYEGVPKDYTGEDVNINNFFSIILENKTALIRGSGKVVESGPDDTIFIYYTNHGGPGVLGMPTSHFLYADHLIDVLKKKHVFGKYKSLVILIFYLRACESGSIFEGLLPEGLKIYATIASNVEESSWGTYYPEDEVHNLRTETLYQQYQLVKKRTANDNTAYGSHVMQFGDIGLSKENLFLYMGANPANDNSPFVDDNSLRPPQKAVDQRDADLLHFWHKLCKAPEGSSRKLEAQKQFFEAMSHRMHIDHSVKLIGKLLFGIKKGPEVLNAVRPAGQPLVRTFETHCGSLSQYGMKHMRSFANMCNAGIRTEQMTEAGQACARIPSGPWSSLSRRFSA